MKVNDQIIKRFDELDRKALNIDQTMEDGDYGSYVNNTLFHEWATSALGLLQRVFSEKSIHYNNFKIKYDTFNGADYEFDRLRGIFNAAREDYFGGYLFEIKTIVSAEVLDDVLEQAQELIQANYKDPACVVIGVVLETTLKRLCEQNKIQTGSLERMNTELCKASIYNLGMQKQITAWAERRNNAAHGKWDKYSIGDVTDMHSGVSRFIAEYL